MQDLIEGVEQVQAVKTDDYGTIFIFYTVTDEFMKEKELNFKNRVFEINVHDQNELVFTSYAVLG